MASTLIKNAIIVNEGKSFKGAVVIQNDTIIDVLHDNALDEQLFDNIVDAKGNYLIPGIIDDHVHFREPGLTYKADIFTESRAAVAGGVTSYMDMPNTNPQTTTIEALEEKFRIAQEKSIANYSFYFGATNNNSHMLSSLDKKNICGIKLFMGSSTGNMLVDRKEVLNNIFKNSNMIIAAHCEEQSIISKNSSFYKKYFGEDVDIKYHPLIRSEEACFYSTALAIELAKANDARLHILHLTTEKELSLLEDKPIANKLITAEACIAHLYFSDEDYKKLGSLIKCNPAIKSINDRNALRAAIQSDLIDVIATDHAPHLLTEKEGGAFKAMSGMPMIQFSLIAMLELEREGIITIEEIVKKMCHNPATLYNIERRGFIRKGYKADLVIVNHNSVNKIKSKDVLSRCEWTPLDGMTLHSKVEKTFVNGNLVYSNNTIIEGSLGEHLTFTR